MTTPLTRLRRPRAAPKLTLWPLDTGHAPPATPFVALLPGAEVPMLALDLPPGLRGRERLRVAERQLADLLGSGAEALEMRPASLSPDGAPWTRVLVADRAQLAEWRARIAAAGPACRALLPDYLALPAAEAVWTIATGQGCLQARLGLADGFSAEPALARAMLETALATDGPPACALRLGPPQPEIDEMLAARKIPLARDAESIAALGLAPPRSFAHGELLLDLAQDRAAAAESLRRALLPWRLPAAMAAAAFVLWSAGTVMQTQALREQALTERRATEDLARRALVPSGPILDLRAQIARAVAAQESTLAGNRGETAPLDLLRAASEVLADGAAQVNTVSLRPGAGLLVDVELADFAALDTLVAGLRAAGIAPRVAQSAAGDTGTVTATLMLAAAAAGQAGPGARAWQR